MLFYGLLRLPLLELKCVQHAKYWQPAGLVVALMQVFLDIWHVFYHESYILFIIVLEQNVEALLDRPHAFLVSRSHELLNWVLALHLL